MPLKVKKTSIDGVLVLEPKVFEDQRGYFFESFNQRDFNQATGLNENFVQDNHSMSKQGVLRGLHYQTQDAQGKLVRVVKGAVFDVVVDIRRGSPSFGQWFGVELSAENKKQLWIPAGFAHGFLVTSEVAVFLYKTTHYYNPEYEKTLLWNDEALKISWPLAALKTPPVLSSKDAVGLTLNRLMMD